MKLWDNNNELFRIIVSDKTRVKISATDSLLSILFALKL